ncbi:MAG TPA: hypothetical protein PLB79_06865 [Thermotogota bacterium]|nr:hypothetical protein [Thermotogaceae bacterium]OQC32150.1 MAG: hypothetical protein BWX67_00571 [Thermotogota bacterium ADurb.Bin062]HNW46855.1 hypothetical protein [Thermotogota bacterium]HOH12148.1 hypothetical protein [Thermotogota bacterium]HOX65518.1 hypothetical protein [Thermotogota bacterium]
MEIKQAVVEEKKKVLFATYSQNGYTASAKELLLSSGVYALKIPENR